MHAKEDWPFRVSIEVAWSNLEETQVRQQSIRKGCGALFSASGTTSTYKIIIDIPDQSVLAEANARLGGEEW